MNINENINYEQEVSKLKSNEEWAYFISTLLHYNYNDMNDMLHDLNNLRAIEWYEMFIEENNLPEIVLESFKKYFKISYV